MCVLERSDALRVDSVYACTSPTNSYAGLLRQERKFSPSHEADKKNLFSKEKKKSKESQSSEVVLMA